MKTTTKYGLILGSTALAIVAIYFLVPIQQWKKYKENHPSLFEVQDDATPTYINFCKSYWKAFFAIGTPKEEDITYDGGELPEVVVKPNNE